MKSKKTAAAWMRKGPPRKIKTTLGDRVFHAVNNTVMILLALVMVYPVYYVLIASLSSAQQLITHRGFLLLPIAPTFAAYEMAFQNPLLLRSYGNTLFVVAAGVAVNLVLTTIGAYFLSRKQVKLQKPIMIMIVITMFFSGGMIPFYFAVKDLGLDGSLWALIFPSAISTFNLIIMKTSFLSIPDSMEESARLDGAGHITILTRVILPLSKATLAVIGLYYAVSHWNAWFHAMLFLKEREQFPLQLLLREILLQNNVSDIVDGTNYSELGFISETIKYAVIIIATLPILCVYPFIQKYFTKGVMIGAVKG